MADEVYTFDLASMKKLAAAYRRLERQVQDLRAVVQTQPRGDRGAEHYLIYPIAQIPARSYGNAYLGKIGPGGTPQNLGPRELVFNHSDFPLPAAQWTVGHKERGSHRFVPCTPSAGVGFLQVRNDSGFDVDRYQILGLSGVVTTATANLGAFLNGAIFTGITPAACSHEGKFVIAQEPIAYGAIGACLVSGATQVKVLVKQPTHKYADIVSGERRWLESRRYGSARILFLDGTSNDEWAIARLSNLAPSQWRAELTGSWSGGAANADLLELDGTATGKAIIVKDPLGAYAEYESGDELIVTYDVEDCEYYAIDAACKE